MQAKQKQSGFALLLFLLMVMAIGGIALTGYAQKTLKQVEEKNFQHNKEVLEQAKQALLMFAYNYPQTNTNGVGPGRLPCPDHDNNGAIDFPLNCNTVGRFPWQDVRLNFFDAKDASGERLWYAVSNAFDNVSGGGVINSDTAGTITIFDQTGNLLYDGAVSGIAAVIIAPGSAINGQDRSIANGDDPFDQAADNDPGIINPVEYLDSFNGFDNSTFVNSGNAAAEGFILGPVFDPAQNIITVNDQMVIVTADEVIAMAEKATLQAYRDAIDEYQQNIWGGATANYRYPWLDDYSTTLLTEYDAEINTVIGRVPSIFANYFDDSILQDSQPIDSEVKLRVSMNGFYTPDEEVPGLSSISFDTDGDLSVIPATTDSNTFVKYYWDERVDPDGWELCPQVTFSIQDCHQDDIAPGIPDPSLPSNEVIIRVIEVTYTYDLVNSSGFTRPYGDNTGSAIVFDQAGTDHAYSFFEYDENVSDAVDVSYIYDGYYLAVFDNVANGTNYYMGVRYYPSLPFWALATENNWHSSIQMAVTQDYQPGGDGDCTVSGCFIVDNLGGVNNNKASLLVLAGQHDLIDELLDGYANDLLDIFEPENDDSNLIYDRRAGNDTVLVLQEQ